MAGSESSPKFWIYPHSPATGRRRSRTLVAAAEKVWPYVVQNCESILRDRPAAGEIMERAVLALERRRAPTKISDLSAFLARTAIREIRHEFQRRMRERSTGIVFEVPSSSDPLKHDRHILASQVLALVREELLDLFLKRLAGLSWSEIGMDEPFCRSVGNTVRDRIGQLNVTASLPGHLSGTYSGASNDQ